MGVRNIKVFESKRCSQLLLAQTRTDMFDWPTLSPVLLSTGRTSTESNTSRGIVEILYCIRYSECQNLKIGIHFIIKILIKMSSSLVF
jgi:hypothetical protein